MLGWSGLSRRCSLPDNSNGLALTAVAFRCTMSVGSCNHGLSGNVKIYSSHGPSHRGKEWRMGCICTADSVQMQTIRGRQGKQARGSGASREPAGAWWCLVVHGEGLQAAALASWQQAGCRWVGKIDGLHTRRSLASYLGALHRMSLKGEKLPVK